MLAFGDRQKLDVHVNIRANIVYPDASSLLSSLLNMIEKDYATCESKVYTCGKFYNLIIV